MLSLYLFGKPEVQPENQPAIRFPTTQLEAIFCYLVYVKKPVQDSDIAHLFWQGIPPGEQAAAWLSATTQLQSLLGEYLEIGSKELRFLKQSEHWVDLYDLNSRLEAEDFPHRQKLTMIRTLYRGELLSGLAETESTAFRRWLLQERQLIKSKVNHALHMLTEHFLQQSDFTFGFKATLWWLMLEPGNEQAHRLRMRLFWHNQQRSAALLQYNVCSEYLHIRLGIEPSEETKQLCLQIQQDAPNVDKATQSLSLYRRANHNVPRAFTRFVGRESEMALLRQMLLHEKKQLVAIVGEGGVGKTRLAMEIAQRVLANPANQPFRDGIWFISCAGIENDHLATERLGSAIGRLLDISLQGTSPIFEEIGSALAHKSLLLVLDNFEHLAEHLAVLQALLQQATQVQVLLTSRHLLDLSEAQQLRLDGLLLPAINADLGMVLSPEELSQLLTVPSIRILSERATNIWSFFSIQQHNGMAAAKLCHLLDGNPLALELAATLLLSYDMAELFRGLSQNYMLLAADLHDLPPRQRSIHNTIDYTWQLLPPQLASVMAQCSSFRGSFSRADALAIPGSNDQIIQQLLDRFLLYRDGEESLRIHEMVRQFAARRL